VPKVLDLCCKAGGITKGWQMAGFYVVGVDIEPQPHYCGDKFIQADATTLDVEFLKEFDIIVASPPCQRYSILTPAQHKDNHPDLIGPIRELLIKSKKPYVIENVSGARRLLINPVMLCGTMFGLNLFRHRYFEIPWLNAYLLPPCNHGKKPVLVSGTTSRLTNGKRKENTAQEIRDAIGIDWMIKTELDEAIPPAYSKWIAEQFLMQAGAK
jgi:DNA (cytosine-5)-methyltransferase 1